MGLILDGNIEIDNLGYLIRLSIYLDRNQVQIHFFLLQKNVCYANLRTVF